MVLLHSAVRGKLACATMVTVLLVLALRLSDAATLAAPSAELSKPPAALRELATGLNA